MAPDRFTADELGMDELVLSGVDIHMERMNGTSMWIGIYRGDKRISLFLTSKGNVRVNIAEDDIGITKDGTP